MSQTVKLPEGMLIFITFTKCGFKLMTYGFKMFQVSGVSEHWDDSGQLSKTGSHQDMAQRTGMKLMRPASQDTEETEPIARQS